MKAIACFIESLEWVRPRVKVVLLLAIAVALPAIFFARPTAGQEPPRPTQRLVSTFPVSAAPGQYELVEQVLDFSPGAAALGEFEAWSAPINVGQPLNTQYNDMYAILTADGLTVYFTSDRPGGLGGDDLWVSRRESTEAPWGEPENLAVLNSPFNDSLSVFNASGNIMYFHSTRPGGSCGAGDLWTSRAKPGGDAWTAPVNMGCVVNTGSTEIAPAFYANDDLGLSTIYFGSNRPGSLDYDIYGTTTTDGDLESAVWGPGVLVPELSSPARDTRTFVRKDGREIFITTNRDFGVGGLDIWVATREDSSQLWSTPVNPGAPLNSAADDGSPALSRDGRTLYYFSTRPGGSGGRDIWFTVRTKP